MSNIEAIWQRIEVWYAAQDASDLLNAGATQKEIQEVETQLDVSFPNDFHHSLQRHDGVGNWLTGELLSLEGLQQERGIWMELLNDGTFDDNAAHDASEGKGKSQAGWWNAGWIPIDADGGGNGFVMDLNPGPNGKIGQILYMDHEVGPSGPHYASFSDYLEDMAQKLESGEYVYHDGYVCEAADLEDD